MTIAANATGHLVHHAIPAVTTKMINGSVTSMTSATNGMTTKMTSVTDGMTAEMTGVTGGMTAEMTDMVTTGVGKKTGAAPGCSPIIILWNIKQSLTSLL